MNQTKNTPKMKQLLAVIALSACTFTGFMSCTKSSSSSSPYVMSATKDGSNVSFSGQSNVVALVSGPILEIEGVTESGNDTTGFIFFVNNYTGPGSYTIDGTTNVGEYLQKTGATGSVIFATSGNITITSATSPTMKGTFNFSGSGTSITNGTFTAHF